MIKNRYLSEYIFNDLQNKMVFISGPRQVGKTTLAYDLMKEKFKSISYYNWDNRQDRSDIMKSNYAPMSDLIVFDEIHKMKKWKNFVKGEYDKLKNKYKFIVTGSAALDIYRKGGDSLQGRYHFYRLHPFTLNEVLNNKINVNVFGELNFSDKFYVNELNLLFKYGGFPEPFLKQDEVFMRRWNNEKIERLFREDIRDTTLVKDISSMKLLGDLLAERSSSLLSINSLREDLEVSFKSVKNWIDIFESFYYVFRIYPYTTLRYRALKKEPKIYFWDWSEIQDESRRFENMIALHLLKFAHFLYDSLGYKTQLYFLRDLESREIDFLFEVDKKIWFIVEVKLNDESLSSNFKYFINKLNIPYSYQVIKKENIDKFTNGVRIISASKFLTGLI
ncbi:MAG: ATP-binding protein [Elusimicrobiales bacterium]|jgi:predicted AAA+ superfamily ATPase|nr:ATP-binding protein [Elusimicrobiales bacterium]